MLRSPTPFLKCSYRINIQQKFKISAITFKWDTPSGGVLFLRTFICVTGASLLYALHAISMYGGILPVRDL